MARPIRSSLSITAALLATGLACAEPAPPPAGEEAPPIPADTASVVTAPTLLDSVPVWAGDIRAGIAPLPAQFEADPLAARQRAVELYVTRQERIEQTVGPGTGSDPQLAEAVHEAEARFHELMQLLDETPPPDSTRVAGAVRALDTRIGDVTDLFGRPADGASRDPGPR